jgi:putative addiction module antidote
MAMAAKIIAIGNSAGIILPKQFLERLSLQVGDTICLSKAPFGAHLTPCDDEFADKLDATERMMRKYRGALRRLAK